MLRVLQAVEPAAKLSPPAVLSDGVCSEELLSGVEWLLVLHLGIARCGVDRLALSRCWDIRHDFNCLADFLSAQGSFPLCWFPWSSRLP